MSHYSFVCDNGCGECGVMLIPFEAYRSETPSGVVLEQKFEPQVVSSCCASPVSVYDNYSDMWLDGGVNFQGA